MAIRNIIKEGDETLLKRSREITAFDKRLQDLIKDMKDTLKKAEGLGLAAPQVGILKRVVIVIDEKERALTLINPEIIYQEGEQEGQEGCLSIPGVFAYTSRPAKIKVKALNEKGKPIAFTTEGRTAVCCCHEIDHLNGILFRTHVKKYMEKD